MSQSRKQSIKQLNDSPASEMIEAKTLITPTVNLSFHRSFVLYRCNDSRNEVVGNAEVVLVSDGGCIALLLASRL